ncbi:MAG: hypothetical protein ACYS32_02195 [Planctomycetota bacterium]
MPDDITGHDGLFHPAAIVRNCLFEIFVDQPGAGGPDEAILAALLAESF